MSKYAPLTLRTIAAITSATSAAAAYPAASNLFGMFPGGVMVASSAAAIYAGWHIVATSANTDYRIVSGVTAALFAGVMTVGIHSSGQLKAATQATGTAEQADTLYINQESTRMATLATVAAELRATQKSKYPAEYAALQAQIDKLSTPTVRTATATQTAAASTGSIYPWVVAGLLEVVSPALLLLAGMFGRERKGNQGQPLTIASFQGQPEGQLRATEGQQGQLEGQQGQLEGQQGQLEGQQGQLEGQPEGNSRATDENQQLEEVADTEWQPWGNPLEALKARAVAFDAEGNVILAALVALTDCTQKQARTAFAKAVEIGILTKTGEGGATRYRYAKQALRVIK